MGKYGLPSSNTNLYGFVGCSRMKPRLGFLPLMQEKAPLPDAFWPSALANVKLYDHLPSSHGANRAFQIFCLSNWYVICRRSPVYCILILGPVEEP